MELKLKCLKFSAYFFGASINKILHCNKLSNYSKLLNNLIHFVFQDTKV